MIPPWAKLSTLVVRKMTAVPSPTMDSSAPKMRPSKRYCTRTVTAGFPSGGRWPRARPPATDPYTRSGSRQRLERLDLLERGAAFKFQHLCAVCAHVVARGEGHVLQALAAVVLNRFECLGQRRPGQRRAALGGDVHGVREEGGGAPAGEGLGCVGARIVLLDRGVEAGQARLRDQVLAGDQIRLACRIRDSGQGRLKEPAAEGVVQHD